MLKSDLSRNLSDLALPSDSSKSGVMMERVLHVSIRNSLSNLALAGQNGGVWRLVEGSAPRTLGEGATCQLNSALMHEVTILQQHSDFPVPLGVHLNCVPPKEFTEIGDAYSYTVLPNSKMSTPETIFKAQPLSEDMYDWHETFPGYNDKNLDTEGIMHVKNHGMCFIDVQHPAVAVLRANQHLTGIDVDAQKKLDGKYIKISQELLQTCLDTIRTKVLSQMATFDLNTLCLQLHRPDGRWEDIGDGHVASAGLKLAAGMSDEEQELAKREHMRKFVTTPYTYMARIKIKYEVPRAPRLA
jgi:hypothetical protein